MVVLCVLLPAVLADDAMESWASKHHPQDAAQRHVESISAARHEYRIQQGGTMDGANCRSPIGGGFAIWEQTWESNRAVRLENVGDTDLINPWLSNGRNDFRTVGEIVSSAVRPGMGDLRLRFAFTNLTNQACHSYVGCK